jgi:hypothetical protein
LKSFVSKAPLPGDVEIEFAAKDGTIYDAIKEKADEISATFVVMELTELQACKN